MPFCSISLKTGTQCLALIHWTFSVLFGSMVWKFPRNQQNIKSSRSEDNNKLVLLAVMDRLRYRHLQPEFKARMQVLMGPSFAASWTHTLWTRNFTWMQTVLHPSANNGAFCVSDIEIPQFVFVYWIRQLIVSVRVTCCSYWESVFHNVTEEAGIFNGYNFIRKPDTVRIIWTFLLILMFRYHPNCGL